MNSFLVEKKLTETGTFCSYKERHPSEKLEMGKGEIDRKESQMEFHGCIIQILGENNNNHCLLLIRVQQLTMWGLGRILITQVGCSSFPFWVKPVLGMQASTIGRNRALHPCYHMTKPLQHLKCVCMEDVRKWGMVSGVLIMHGEDNVDREKILSLSHHTRTHHA